MTPIKILQSLILTACGAFILLTAPIRAQEATVYVQEKTTYRYVGLIVAINGDRNTLDMRVLNGKPFSLRVRKSAEIKVNGDRRDLTDLRPDDRVTVFAEGEKDNAFKEVVRIEATRK